jgi:hypothetical protein
MNYMGIPLQLFGKGSVFGPYTPLQQLDVLTDLETKSYVVGSTNSLLIQQKNRYCDVLVDLDDNSVNILTPALRSALSLTIADRRWIDFITQQVNDTWDDADPGRPKTHGYAGSEEFIRLQFEEYLTALLASEKDHRYLVQHKGGDPRTFLADVEGDPSSEYGNAFLEAWRETENYRLWARTTDSHIFDITEPRHPMAGGLTVEDVQRRLAAQIAELHLDERLNQTREVVNKRIADGRVQVTSAFNRVWTDIETMREAQRKRSEEARAAAAAAPPGEKPSQKTDLQHAQATVAAASQRAGAYLSSWGAWAAEKRRTGWSSSRPASVVASNGSTSPVDRPKVTTVSELAPDDGNRTTTTTYPEAWVNVNKDEKQANKPAEKPAENEAATKEVG